MNFRKRNLLKNTGCRKSNPLWTNPLKVKKLLLTPLVFLSLQMVPFFLYFADFRYWWILTILIQLVLCFTALFISSWRSSAFIVLIVLLYFNLSWFLYSDPLPPTCSDKIDTLTGTVKSGSFEKKSSIDFIKVTIWCRGKSTNRPVVRMNMDGAISLKPARFQPGDILELKYLSLIEEGFLNLTVKPAPGFRIFNLSFQSRVLSRSPLLLYLQAKTRYYLDGFALGVTKALTTADRTSIGPYWFDIFKKLGIIHIFAISGMHIGIIYLWLSFFFRRLISIPCLCIEKGYGIFLSDFFSLILITLFLKMIGMPISAKRAVFMLAWWLLIKHLFYWQPLWFVLLGVATGILLNNPAAIGQISFQLSFLSVTGILVILPLLPVGTIDDSFISKTVKRFLSPFFISCWLLVFTFPIVHALTGYQSLSSPLNNFFHILFVSTVFLPVLIVVLSFHLLGFYTGIEVGEFYVYTIVNFLAKIWEKLLLWNHSVNTHTLIKIPFQWGVISLSIFWLLLIGIPLYLASNRHSK